MRHAEVRTKAAMFIRRMPDFGVLKPDCPMCARKVALRLMPTGIYKTHSITGLENAAPGLIKLAKQMGDNDALVG